MSRERFVSDQRVIFRTGVQWFEGKVTRVNSDESYRVQKYEQFCESMGGGQPPMNRPGDSYDIAPENIRVLPKETSIMDRYLEAMIKNPTFQDPFAHLYMESEEPDTKDKAKTSRASEKSSFSLKIPTTLVDLTSQEDVSEIVKKVYNRRKVVEGSSGWETIDGTKTVDSILSRERDIVRLTEQAQSDSEVMLQLADLTRFGLLGIQKDVVKAQNRYVCAAWGVGEAEHQNNRQHDCQFSYPMGTNEALCAAAQEMFCTLGLMLQLDRTDRIVPLLARDYASGHYDRQKLNIMRGIVSFLGHAIRRDWTCPFALELIQQMRENKYLDPFSPDVMQLINVLECREAQENEVNLRGVPPGMKPPPQEMARPSAYQLERFRPKATEIFLNLPIRHMNPSGRCRSDLHVEYREMPFPPYPILVSNINPPSRYSHPPVTIPEEFEYTPFSREAFECIWAGLVFNMHMGDKKGGRRFRPALITFNDKPGDRLFASYVKNAIGKCGTEIRVVDTRTHQVQLYGGSKKTLREIQEEHETLLGSRMRLALGCDDSQIRTPIELSDSRFSKRIDMSIDELLTKVENLKGEGNRYFTRGRIHPANRCYTEAIDLIRVTVSPNDRAQLLLGTLLSNRAACFLKMAEGMSNESAKNALKSALSDCVSALKSSLVRVIPESIKTKLERRKKEAIEGISRLASHSTSFSDFLAQDLDQEQSTEDSSHQQRQQQPRRQRGQGKNKRGKKKKKKLQRRRRRQQRNQERETEDGLDHFSEDEDGETEENGHESISVTLGKDLLESNITPFITGREDPCPCCFERFRVELSDTFTIVNSCGHAYCLPCLSGLWKKSNRRTNAIPFTCPICRVPISEDILPDSVDPIISCTRPLQDRITSLPLRKEESKQVVHELMFQHHFKIAGVLSALDSMLTDGLQSSLRCSKALSPSEKQEIYEKARRPVDVLWIEANELCSKMDNARDLESEEYIKMKERLNELQTALIPAAQKSAGDYIWERMNTTGKMGVESVSGQIEIDFHALHIEEAIQRFDERVLPILPAVESILLIVGRGSHSEGGHARLKPALKRHIENHSKIRHNRVEGNDGMIRVNWII